MFCRVYIRDLLVFSLLVAGARCLEEPLAEGHCSRFVYEYKLMERLVKLELEMEAARNKMAEVESTCLVGAKALLNSPPPLVAMKARMTSAKSVKNGDRFVYDAIVSNVGDGYDTKTGVFTAPVGGIYSFTVSVCLNPNNWMVVAVFRDNGKIGQVLGGDNAYHTCTNDYSTVKLDAFDKVWVEKTRGNTDSLNEDYGWNSFSANLLQSE